MILNSFSKRRLAVLSLLASLVSARAADLYVSPTGSASGPGTLAQPYNLTTALSGSVGAAGDTFWLRGGVHSIGHIDTQIHGSPGAPITFRQMPGEKARVAGSFTVWNSTGWVVFRDFEMYSADTSRVSSQTGVGFSPTDIKIIPGIASYSPNFSFINLVIHDQTRHGIYVSESATNNLVYGCVIYNNGWRSPDNAEGHGLYIQSDYGTKEISDNLVFNQSGANIHIYQNSSGGHLVGVTLDGNTAFNAGGIQNTRSYRDWVVGVDSPSIGADKIVFKNNMGYFRPGSAAYTQVQIGRDGANGSIVMTGNYFPMGLLLNNWSTTTFSGNVFAPQNSDYAIDSQQTATSLSATWNNNTYSSPSSGNQFQRNSTGYTFSGWKSATGFDSSSTDAVGALTGTKVFVRPNRYQTGRAHIIVYNWNKLSTVPADVSSALPIGTQYEVRNAEDFFAPPVLSGTFDGQPLNLPMTGLTVATPTGGMTAAPATGPTFNIFILLPLSGSSSTNSNTTPKVSSIGSQSTTIGTPTAPIPFTVGDAETAASSLTVSGSSSNPTLLPNANIVFGGSGANRTATLIPTANQSGTATITITVSDGQLTGTTSFGLAVGGTTQPPPSGLTFASTSGTITAPFVAASGMVSQTVSSTVSTGGRATYNFTVANPGNYVISAMVNAPSDSANSFYVNIDAMPTDPMMIWDVPIVASTVSQIVSWRGAGTFDANQYSPKVFALSAGTHQLIVCGREPNCGLGTITITPYGTTTAAPTVAVTSPSNGATYTAPASISLTANVTANGHTITKVQYWNGRTFIGEAATAPYSFTWNNVGAGNYNLSASAIYDAGTAASSAPVTVAVTATTPPPSSSLTFAATSGTMTAPFIAGNGVIYQTVNSEVSTGGRAAYSFTVPNGGDYVISAVVNAPNDGANSFYVNIDAEPADPTMIWDVPIFSGTTNQLVSWRGAGTFDNNQFAPKVFTLTAGTHQLIVRGREANCQLGAITITPRATLPLPAPWQALDIGSVGVAGSASISSGAYTVAGAGTLTGTADAFRFVYQNLSGDGEIRAQVYSVQNTGSSGCVGVMIRESLTSGSSYSLVGLTPGGAFRWQARTGTGGSTVSGQSSAAAPPNAWVRLVRSGNTLTSYQSSDGVNWTTVNTSTNVMASNIYIGLGVASGSSGTLNTPIFNNVTAVP